MQANVKNLVFRTEANQNLSKAVKMIIVGIPIEVQKKSIKNIYIHVKAPLGKVIVTAPMRTSDKAIARIVEERSAWIQKQQEQMHKRMAIQDNQVTNSDTDWKSADEQLRQSITELLPKWENITRLKCSTWQIRKMKTRWGSCNVKTRKIWFNLYLAKTNQRCLEYIILHELLHVKIANHGSEFKSNMDYYMPSWREVRKELKQYIIV